MPEIDENKPVNIMKRSEITIKGESYKVGFSFLAMKEYEKLTGQSVSKIEGTWDNLIFFYATIKALNEQFTLTIDEFVDAMDEHPELLIEFDRLSQANKPAEIPAKKKSGLKKIFGVWMLLALFAVSPVLVPIISILVWIWMSLKLLVRLIATIGRKRALA